MLAILGNSGVCPHPHTYCSPSGRVHQQVAVFELGLRKGMAQMTFVGICILRSTD